MISDRSTVKAARDWLLNEVYPVDPQTGQRELGDGTRCPCCRQHVQVYRWSLYSTAVRMLIRLYRVGGTDEFVESKLVKQKGQGGDTSRLRHWGLVEQASERREDSGKSGFWRVTEFGEQFILRQATVPKYAYVFDGRCLRLAGEEVGIEDCLGKDFRYDDLMAGTL